MYDRRVVIQICKCSKESNRQTVKRVKELGGVLKVGSVIGTGVNEGVADEPEDFFFVFLDVVRPSDFFAAERRNKRRGDSLLRQKTVHLVLQPLYVLLHLKTSSYMNDRVFVSNHRQEQPTLAQNTTN